MKANISIRDYSVLLPFANNEKMLINNLLINYHSQVNDNYLLLKIGDDFVVENYLGTKGIRYYTPQTRYLLSTISTLFNRNEIYVKNEDFGIVTSSTFCSCEDLCFLANDIKKYGGYKGLMPGFAPYFSKNLSSSIASIKTKALAFNVTFESTRTSGYDGLFFGLDSLLSNDAKTLIVSSMEHIDEFVMNLFSLSKAPMESEKTIGNGSVSILLDSVKNLPQKGEIVCYDTGFIKNKQTAESHLIIRKIINKCLFDAEIEAEEVGLIIANIQKDSEMKAFLDNELDNIFPTTIVYYSLKGLGNFFSLNPSLNIIISCELLSSGIPFNLLEENEKKGRIYNDKKHSLIIDISHNGIINTQIIPMFEI
jgi:hypothetical protein